MFHYIFQFFNLLKERRYRKKREEAIKKYNLAYPVNYLIKLVRNDNTISFLDLEKIFTIQSNRIYKYNFIRGHTGFNLTIIKEKGD